MSINNPVYPRYRKKQKDWQLIRGRETFYDDDDRLITFETKGEAIEWALSQGYEVQLEMGKPES
jgi:hypothetical protein